MATWIISLILFKTYFSKFQMIAFLLSSVALIILNVLVLLKIRDWTSWENLFFSCSQRKVKI